MSKLLLNIDDATRVAMNFLRRYVDSFDPDELEDIVHSEMEQKSYIANMGQYDARKELIGLIMDINPREIGEQIAENNLKVWCDSIQTATQIALIRMGERGEKGADDEGNAKG